ncbi:MAG TPA: lytic murein transglycosylase [Kineosporiaceae bacterium]
MRDTDGGALDGDPVWDHAVGPMQFLPRTWRQYAQDGDHDGVTNPQDVNDAAATAARYLCAAGRDLSTPAGRLAAVLRYNDSLAYADSVLQHDAVYGGDRWAVIPPSPAASGAPSRTPAAPSHRPTTATTTPTGIPTPGSGQSWTPTPGSNPTPTSESTATPTGGSGPMPTSDPGARPTAAPTPGE